MNDITPKEASNFCGYLKKKSPNLLKGYQKRFFRILEGKILTYFKSEDCKDPKGLITIENIIDLQKNGKDK